MRPPEELTEDEKSLFDAIKNKKTNVVHAIISAEKNTVAEGNPPNIGANM